MSTTTTDRAENSDDREQRTVEDIEQLLLVGCSRFLALDGDDLDREKEEGTRVSSSSFDKVLFGLLLVLRKNNESIDHLIVNDYDEKNSKQKMNVGQKLRLAEKLVKAIERLRCPFKIEAHQIVGLDSQELYPVYHWLIKRAMVCEEREKKNSRKESLRSFDVGNSNSSNSRRLQEQQRQRRSFNDVSTLFARRYGSARRILRRAPETILRDLENDDEIRLRNGCLIEFGHKVTFKGSIAVTMAAKQRAALDATNKGNDDEQIADDDYNNKNMNEEEIWEKEEMKLKRLLSEYFVNDDESSGEDTTSVVSSSVAELLVKMKGEEIAKALSEFGESTSSSFTMHFTGLSGAAGKILRIERATRAVAKRLELEKIKLDEKKKALETSEEEMKKVKELYENAKSENEKMNNRRIDLENSVTDPEQKKLIDALASMAKQRASLKKEEVFFRKTCKKELKLLKQKVISIEAEREESGELAKIAETETIHETEKDKRDKRNAELAKRSKKIAILSRRLDDVPHSAELAQYETRFRELKNAVTHKLRETRRQFARYNSLAKRNEHAAKEISILTSIKEQLHLLDTKIGKQSLRDSLKDISIAVSKTADGTEKKKMNEKRAEELLADDAREQTEARKRYIELTKEFKLLCAREEKCLKKLNSGDDDDDDDDHDDDDDDDASE